jgi:hypothetical protein
MAPSEIGAKGVSYAEIIRRLGVSKNTIVGRAGATGSAASSQ